MAGRTIFNFRVLRCPSCSATLPVRAGDVMVTCEYCEARVQVSRSKTPSAAPTPPPRSSAGAPRTAQVLTAKPHASVFAWLLFAMMFIASFGGVLFTMLANTVDTDDVAAVNAPTQALATPIPAAYPPTSKGEPGDAESDDPRGPNDAIPPATETETETKTEPETTTTTTKKSKTTKKNKAARPREPKLPEPTGPVLSVPDAQRAIEGKILSCMREQGVHDILAYMGNSKVGAVTVLGDSRTRTDGVRKRIKGTKLGTCMNRAGATIRARAFKSNYLRFSLVVDSLPDPLGHLPEKSDRAEIDRIIATADPQVLECAKKHGEEGAKEIFMFTIDGPSGKPLSVHAGYRGRAFKRCAEPIYKKLRFPKVREWTIKVTKHLQM